MLLVLCGLCRQNAEPGEADKQRVANPPPNSSPRPTHISPWWPPDISLWKCSGQEGINIPPSQSEAQQQLHAITDSFQFNSSHNRLVAKMMELQPNSFHKWSMSGGATNWTSPFFCREIHPDPIWLNPIWDPSWICINPWKKHISSPKSKTFKTPSRSSMIFAARTPCASAWSSGASGTPWRTSPTCSAACVRWTGPVPSIDASPAGVPNAWATWTH